MIAKVNKFQQVVFGISQTKNRNSDCDLINFAKIGNYSKNDIICKERDQSWKKFKEKVTEL